MSPLISPRDVDSRPALVSLPPVRIPGPSSQSDFSYVVAFAAVLLPNSRVHAELQILAAEAIEKSRRECGQINHVQSLNVDAEQLIQ